MSVGLLLINLGTPRSPSPEDVGVYLKEFLMDPYVIDIPFPLRWFLVNVLIVPRRKHKSAEAYAKVFTERGSPLLFHTQDLTKAIKSRFKDLPVEFGMRYGQPSLETAIDALKAKGCDHILAIPLYPQFAESSTLTALIRCRELARWRSMRLDEVEMFYSSPYYLNAQAEQIRKSIESWGGMGRFDSILMSFHSLPERHITRLSPNHCLKAASCCDRISELNRHCYRAHCFYTARELAKHLGLPREKWEISFQSRLGRSRWIQPTTDDLYIKLAAQGKKRIAVVCPSFVSDCLETLEEIQIRGQDDFRKAGGESVRLIPCLNSEDHWVDALEGMIRERLKLISSVH